MASTGGMTEARRGKARASSAPKSAPAPRKTQPQPLLATLPLDQLPPGMPAEMFTAPGMLAIADLLPIMTAYIDRDEVVRFANKPLADYLEQPRSELLGRSVKEMMGEEIYAARKPLIEAAMAGERQFFVAENDHPTRGKSAVQAEYVPWTSPDGSVPGMIMLVKDVTEQMIAERALKESEARFRRIANSAPAMMWVTRIDGSRDFVNDAYISFTGLEPEEARKADWMQQLHPEDRERVRSEGDPLFRAGKPITFEARFCRHDGEWRWLRSVSSPRFGPDGELVGYIGVATDITLAKEAELELRRQVAEQTAQLALSEAQFRAVFEAALEVMVLLKPDGTVLAVNNRREAWRHESPSEAVGEKLWNAPTMRNYPQHAALMKKAIAAAARGEVFTTEVKMERPGAAIAYLDVSVQPVRDSDGKVVYLLFEARDITELKAAQEQLRQSQKMEALGQLTGGIAHDFNNLLTVVVGGLDLIAKRSQDSKLKRYAENALAAAERGARLTGQLLAFSRVQRLEVRPTYVAPLIENMRPLLRNVLGPGISKEFDLDEAMMPIMADPTQLEVAILNLAINARDAMPEGGTLRFATRLVEIRGDSELEDGDYVELTISDTGTGMDPDVVDRAFEPFFTTKEVGKGTGLGLSMVYGMARQSGGAARIDSSPGKGTSVIMLFRKAEEPVAEARAVPEEAAAPHAPAPLSVLVIDDDPDVRAFIAAALEEAGYRVRQASDGSKGLAALEREAPDLVVLDFIMPGLSGADVATAIRAKHGDLPILFVSGYNETESVKRTAPDAPLLAKPFRAEALHKAVRAAITAG
ncbi:MAG TPA: PAS domain S-box protein [Sphingomicrobium sp.]|nr:PAS domain S-box protein [Sphingomicrobium sp.]